MKSNKTQNFIKGYLVLGAFLLSSMVSLQAQSLVGPTSVDVGTTREYQVSGQATNVEWNVPVGATLISSNQTSADIRWDFVGSYSVWITFDEGSGFASLGVNVTGPAPANPPNPIISTNNCGDAILQRVGTPPTGVVWYWQGTNSSGTSTSLGSGSTFTAPVGNNTNYYIRARSGGQWSTGSGSVPVTVINFDDGDIGGTQTVCYGGNPTTLTNVTSPSGGAGGYTYQWQYSNNGLNSWTNISGATSSTYNPPGGLTTTRWYRRGVFSCSGQFVTSATGIKVTVNPTLNAGSIATQLPICYGSDPLTINNVTSPTGGDDSYSYQWQYSDNNSNWTNIGGATSASYNPSEALTAARWYRRQVSSCSETKNTPSIQVAVNAPLIAGSISGNSTPICSGGNPGNLASAANATGGNGSYSYQWQFSANNSNWTTISGATSASYDPPTGLLFSRYYRRGVSSCNETLYTPSFQVTVHPNVAAATGANVSTCEQGDVMLMATPGANGDTILWYSTPTGGSSLETGTNFTVNVSGPTTYYAESFNQTTGCASATRTAIQVIFTGQTAYYADFDNDGLGDPNDSLDACSQPTDYVLDNSDLCPNLPDPSNTCQPVPPPSSNPQEHNYIYTRSYQNIVSGTIPFFQADDNLIQNITFFDGLGKPIQQVGIDQNPNKEDIVTHMEYDVLGRMERDYLPHPDADLLGNFRPMAEDNTNVHYNVQKYQNTQNPYSQKEFENSPLNRILKQAAPGNPWELIKGADDHSIEFGYMTNTFDPLNPTNPNNDNVHMFDVDLSGGKESPLLNDVGHYLGGELYKTITKDENHSVGKDHTTEEFTNKKGQVVLKRTYDNEVPHDTYYVYDEYHNLTFVLSPKMDGGMVNLNELGYQYVYDQRNRLVEKRIPGKGKEFIVYNKSDQPIMTQDANQRLIDEWLFTKYDAFGRVAYTGKATDNRSRELIQNEVSNLSEQLWVVRTGVQANFGGVDMEYKDQSYPTAGAATGTTLTEVLTVNYYDDYNFDLNGISLIVGNIYDRAISTEVKGLTTGSMVKVLDPTASSAQAWITTVTQYEDKGRPIHMVSKNDYLGALDVVKMKIDFVGRTLKSRTEHTRNGTTIVTLDNFTYDHIGRLLAQTQCIGDATLGDNCEGAGGGGASIDLVLDGSIDSDYTATNSIVVVQDAIITPENGGDGSTVLNIDPNATGGSGEAELIVLNTYDELGRLDLKKVGGAADATNVLNSVGLQTVNYDYNVRDWLTAINDVNNSGNDLFNFRIGYNEGLNPLFNGNIALTQWKTLSSDPSIRTYNYSYDALNRIKTATDDLNNYSLGSVTNPVTYDKNGNITSLTRKGHTSIDANGLVTAYGDLDVLDYDYYNSGNSNRLYKVFDSSTIEFGFKNSSSDTQDYWYDANGNMTRDLNKGIGNASTDGIIYNHLNLPEEITISGGSILYIYDAMGIKLKKSVSTGISTEYAGNYLYEGPTGNTQLQFFNHPEGYVTIAGQGGYDYVYNYSDHLGNVRLSYMDNNGQLEVIEENNFYPFGMKHQGYNNNISSLGNATAKKWKYQGQELTEDLGLDVYEFKYRMHDPSTGRFWQIDPLAEDFTYNSPYAFSENKVISHFELEGLEAVLGITLGKDVQYRGDILQQAHPGAQHTNIRTGGVDSFVDAFKTASASDPQGIGFAAVWGHGYEGTIYGNALHESTSVSTSDLSKLNDAIKNGEISFTDNAVIYLGNCNSGTCPAGDPRSFAAELSKITGATVIGGNDSVGVGPEGSQVENFTSMIYWMFNPRTDSFLSFENGVEVDDLGGSIDVISLLKRVMNPQVPITVTPAGLAPVGQQLGYDQYHRQKRERLDNWNSDPMRLHDNNYIRDNN